MFSAMAFRPPGPAVLLAGLLALATPAGLPAQQRFGPAPRVLATERLAPGVYAALGGGAGAEGRPNAGFVVTSAGVVAVGGVWSPAHGEALVRTIRTVTRQPLRWFVLHAHHPDMQFGAIALRRAGAGVIAHPDETTLALENGPDQMVADWDQVVGLQELFGFEYANRPDRPVTGTDTLRLGGVTMVLIHPGAAHSAGDLMLWLPDERVLFTGDLLVDDGVTMVVDGSSRAMLAALDLIEGLAPRVIVPGHGAIPADGGAALLRQTRAYLASLRQEMRAAVEQGTSMRRALAGLPPPDEARPVSYNSRRRRNAVRVYVEMEREVMGFGADSVGGPR